MTLYTIMLKYKKKKGSCLCTLCNIIIIHSLFFLLVVKQAVSFCDVTKGNGCVETGAFPVAFKDKENI